MFIKKTIIKIKNDKFLYEIYKLIYFIIYIIKWNIIINFYISTKLLIIF